MARGARSALRWVLAAASVSTAAACAADSLTWHSPSAARLDAGAASDEARPGIDAEFTRIARAAPGFGGMFYDANGRINLYLTHAGQRSAAEKQNVIDKVSQSLRVRGRGVPPSDQMVVLEGTHDYVELATLNDRLLPVLREPGVVFTDIDEVRNRLAVGVLAGTSVAAIQSAVQALGVPADAVDLELTSAVVPFSGTLLERQYPLGGGLQILFSIEPMSLYACTLGFNVLLGAPEREQKYFFTNAHCTGAMGQVDGTRYLMAPGGMIGTEAIDPAFFDCPWWPGVQCRWSDAALVRYQEDLPVDVGRIYRPKALAADGMPGTVSLDDGPHPYFSVVVEQAFPMVGDVLDKIGRTSGWTRGRVVRSCGNYLVSTNPMRVLLCQDRVAAYSDFGDSGSPVFQPLGGYADNVKLYGLLWGGSFQPTRIFVMSAYDNIRYEFSRDCRLVGPGDMVTSRCPQDRTIRTH